MPPGGRSTTAGQPGAGKLTFEESGKLVEQLMRRTAQGGGVLPGGPGQLDGALSETGPRSWAGGGRPSWTREKLVEVRARRAGQLRRAEQARRALEAERGTPLPAGRAWRGRAAVGGGASPVSRSDGPAGRFSTRRRGNAQEAGRGEQAGHGAGAGRGEGGWRGWAPSAARGGAWGRSGGLARSAPRWGPGCRRGGAVVDAVRRRGCGKRRSLC